MDKEFVVFMPPVNLSIFMEGVCPQRLCDVRVTGGASLMLSGARIFQPAHAASGICCAPARGLGMIPREVSGHNSLAGPETQRSVLSVIGSE